MLGPASQVSHVRCLAASIELLLPYKLGEEYGR
jgi:hypothetical protein